jgi:hypothetical protein
MVSERRSAAPRPSRLKAGGDETVSTVCTGEKFGQSFRGSPRDWVLCPKAFTPAAQILHVDGGALVV